MRPMNILAAAMVAGLFVSPAFAQGAGGSESSASAGSNQIHCSPAKNGNAAADPNCAQRDPPMPAPGSSAMAPSATGKSTTQR